MLERRKVKRMESGGVLLADSGKQETAEELLARMNAKYGVGAGKSSAAAQPTQQPAAQPAQQSSAQPQANSPPTRPAPGQAKSAPGSIVDAILQNRDELRKVANYAKGGVKKCAAGAVVPVRGKGSGTSDSVPAVLAGDEVKVSNGEAVVVLPAKTAKNEAALDAIEGIIEATNGEPPVPRDESDEGEEMARGGIKKRLADGGILDSVLRLAEKVFPKPQGTTTTVMRPGDYSQGDQDQRNPALDLRTIVNDPRTITAYGQEAPRGGFQEEAARRQEQLRAARDYDERPGYAAGGVVADDEDKLKRQVTNYVVPTPAPTAQEVYGSNPPAPPAIPITNRQVGGNISSSGAYRGGPSGAENLAAAARTIPQAAASAIDAGRQAVSNQIANTTSPAVNLGRGIGQALSDSALAQRTGTQYQDISAARQAGGQAAVNQLADHAGAREALPNPQQGNVRALDNAIAPATPVAGTAPAPVAPTNTAPAAAPAQAQPAAPAGQVGATPAAGLASAPAQQATQYPGPDTPVQPGTGFIRNNRTGAVTPIGSPQAAQAATAPAMYVVRQQQQPAQPTDAERYRQTAENVLLNESRGPGGGVAARMLMGLAGKASSIDDASRRTTNDALAIQQRAQQAAAELSSQDAYRRGLLGIQGRETAVKEQGAAEQQKELQAQREARAALAGAVDSGDEAAIRKARMKAIAAGVLKDDQAHKEDPYRVHTDQMSGSQVRINQRTGETAVLDRATNTWKPVVANQPKPAPQTAIEALRANPSLAEQFKQKYGYLPQ